MRAGISRFEASCKILFGQVPSMDEPQNSGSFGFPLRSPFEKGDGGKVTTNSSAIIGRCCHNFDNGRYDQADRLRNGPWVSAMLDC